MLLSPRKNGLTSLFKEVRVSNLKVPEACARLHANFGEAWRTLANPQRHAFTRVPAKVPHIHQSSGEGAFCVLGGLQNVPKGCL